MSLADAERASEEFLKVMHEPETWRQRVPSASVLDDVLHHAKELLDIMDDELSDVDRNQSAELFAAAPILRQN